MESCVDTYKDIANVSDLEVASTLFLPESAKDSMAGRPAGTGEVTECPWCSHTFSPVVHGNRRAFDSARCAATK
eukprot:2714276-Lingulodinium_polyedra.AAC.1